MKLPFKFWLFSKHSNQRNKKELLIIPIANSIRWKGWTSNSLQELTFVFTVGHLFGLQDRLFSGSVRGSVCFQFFQCLGGKKVIAILICSSSRGLGTPEVTIASVPVPAFTDSKMALKKMNANNVLFDSWVTASSVELSKIIHYFLLQQVRNSK